MKVDFSKKFLLFSGSESSDLMYETISNLLFSLGKDGSIECDSAKKYSAYLLSRKLLLNKGIVDLTVEEACLIKEVTAVYLTAGGYGQIVDLIEHNNH